MNRIVRESYPVADLPEDLREGFAAGERVRVVIEPADLHRIPEPTLADLMTLRRPPFLSTDEILNQIDRLRDEFEG